MDSVILHIRHIQQHQRGECLAACAAMVLDHIQIAFDYEALCILLGVDWFGTPFSNIRNLSKLGVTVVYKQGTLNELYEHLTNDRPCIALVKTGELPYWDENEDHAVVVVGLDETNIYLNDPAKDEAPIAVSRGDFDLAWLERNELYAALRRR